MEVIDIKAFRKANNLTQTQLGEYLGIDKGFISAIEHGKSKFPKAKLTLLLNNPHNWNTTMLARSVAPVVVGGIGRSKGEVVPQILINPDDGYTRRLKEENAELKKEILDLQKRIWQLEALLTSKGGTAQSAEDSLSASAI